MRNLKASILLGLCFSGLCSAQKQCYYPNGQQAATDDPCDPDDANSVCCGGGQGSVCLTNKLCRSPDGHTIRGSCTDKHWVSADCPQYCLSANTGGTDLISCSNVTKTDTSFCCDHSRPFCCDEGIARFDVLPSNPQVFARWDTQSKEFVKVIQQTSSSSSSSQASTSTTNTSPSATPSTTQPSTPTPESDASTQSQSLSTAAQAGIGVGAAVLVLALAAVAFLLFKLRKKALLADIGTQKQQQQQPQNQGGVLEHKYDTGAGNYSYPRQELGEGLPRQEMEGQGARFELPVTSPGQGMG